MGACAPARELPEPAKPAAELWGAQTPGGDSGWRGDERGGCRPCRAQAFRGGDSGEDGDAGLAIEDVPLGAGIYTFAAPLAAAGAARIIGPAAAEPVPHAHGGNTGEEPVLCDNEAEEEVVPESSDAEGPVNSRPSGRKDLELERTTDPASLNGKLQMSVIDAGTVVAKGIQSIVSQLTNIPGQISGAARSSLKRSSFRASRGVSGSALLDGGEPASHQGQLLALLRRRPHMALQIIIENTKDLTKCYTVEEKELGRGAFGSVRRARVIATGAVRAVKFVEKSRMKGKERFLKAEIEILKLLDHPNLVKLYELFEDSVNIYMVFELCSGGALEDHLRAAGKFTEPQASKAMVQILRAVYYLHSNDIAHRDMKPANCLVVGRDSLEKSSLRVTDFGLSCRCSADQILKDHVGTPAFMSPQVIARSYDRSCDIWACGVTMYMLLCGYTPFQGRTADAMRKRIMSGQFAFPAVDWVHVSAENMSLIRKLLQVDPSRRCTVQKALSSSCLKEKAAQGEPPAALDDTLLRNLRGFRSLNKFKRAALCVIASLLDEERTRDLREAFILLDTDDDGTLNHSEVRARLEAIGGNEMRASVSEDKFLSLDPTPYTYTEFLAATFDRQSFCKKGVCWAAFNAFDTNGDGSISQQELAEGRILGKLSAPELQALVNSFDANCDGSIDFKEFMEMMLDGEGYTPSSRSPSPRSRSRPCSVSPARSASEGPVSGRASLEEMREASPRRMPRAAALPPPPPPLPVAAAATAAAAAGGAAGRAAKASTTAAAPAKAAVVAARAAGKAAAKTPHAHAGAHELPKQPRSGRMPEGH